MSFASFRGSKDDEKPPVTGTTAPISSPSSRAEAYIGKGTKISGTMTFSGPVEIDCQVEGEIFAQDRLTIGESAIVQAKITGADVTIKGTVQGDIIATRRLSLRKPAKVVGNISSAALSIEEGVLFEGKCAMTAPPTSSTSSTTISSATAESKLSPMSRGPALGEKIASAG